MSDHASDLPETQPEARILGGRGRGPSVPEQALYITGNPSYCLSPEPGELTFDKPIAVVGVQSRMQARVKWMARRLR